MYRNFSKIILIFLFTITTQLISAQVPLLDSLTLDTLTGFTDLNEALKNPDAVTKLVLRKQHLKSFPKEILKFKKLGKEIKISPKTYVSVNKEKSSITYGTESISINIGIGKNHVAHLTMSLEAWEALNEGQEIKTTTLKEFKKEYL